MIDNRIRLVSGLCILSLTVFLCCSSVDSKKSELTPETKALKEKLTPLQFQVTQQGATERAFTGKYWDNKAKGVYRCICCGAELFDSETKFKSGTGWPSFYDIKDSENVALKSDYKLLVKRTEVACKKCDAHLGHVFNDGPEPTGKRYCINSAALDFEERN